MSSGSLPDVTLVQEAFCLAQLVGAEGCIHMYPGSSRAVTGTRDTAGQSECRLSQTEYLFSAHQDEVLSQPGQEMALASHPSLEV